jgi:hypothetical protein
VRQEVEESGCHETWLWEDLRAETFLIIYREHCSTTKVSRSLDDLTFKKINDMGKDMGLKFNSKSKDFVNQIRGAHNEKL